MSTKFELETTSLQLGTESLIKLIHRMLSIREDAVKAINSLDWDVEGEHQLSIRMIALIESIDTILNALKKTKNCLEQINQEYLTCFDEAKKLVQELPESISQANLPAGSISTVETTPGFWDQINIFFDNVKGQLESLDDVLKSNIRETANGIASYISLNLGGEKEIFRNVLGYTLTVSGSVTNNTNGKINVDVESDGTDFSFKDPSSGISGDIGTDGNIKLKYNKEIFDITIGSDGELFLGIEALKHSTEYYEESLKIGNSADSFLWGLMSRKTTYEYNITTKPSVDNPSSMSLGIKLERDNQENLKQRAYVAGAALVVAGLILTAPASLPAAGLVLAFA